MKKFEWKSSIMMSGLSVLYWIGAMFALITNTMADNLDPNGNDLSKTLNNVTFVLYLLLVLWIFIGNLRGKHQMYKELSFIGLGHVFAVMLIILIYEGIILQRDYMLYMMLPFVLIAMALMFINTRKFLVEEESYKNTKSYKWFLIIIGFVLQALDSGMSAGLKVDSFVTVLLSASSFIVCVCFIVLYYMKKGLFKELSTNL